MKLFFNYVPYILIIVLFVNISCEKNSTGPEDEEDLEESLDPIEEVELISGGENATITVNMNGDEAYFDVQFSDIESNNVIQNGSRKAWCIDIWRSIDHNGGTYTGIPLYSTYRVEKWKPLNYLFNIEEKLLEENPELTWREFQVVIWSLRANPEFNLDKVDIEELPGQFHDNGEPTFSPQKVKEILNVVENGYRDFNYATSDKFAVIAETPSDIQTIITIVEKE